MDRKKRVRIKYEKSILKMEFIREFYNFLRVRKKFWLFPIILILAIFGGIIILTQGSAIAPFMYTLF